MVRAIRRAGAARGAATAGAARGVRLLAAVPAGRRTRDDPAVPARGVSRAAAGAGRRPRSPTSGHRPMIDQPVGPGRAPRRRRRRQRAGPARPAARARATTSDIFALTIDDDLRGDVRPWHDAERAAGRRDDPPFRHALADDARRSRRCRARACSAITTSRRRAFFAPFDTGLARLTALGRRELATLAGRVDLALGVSELQPARTRARSASSRPASCRSSCDTDRLRQAPRPSRQSNACSRTA